MCIGTCRGNKKCPPPKMEALIKIHALWHLEEIPQFGAPHCQIFKMKVKFSKHSFQVFSIQSNR